MSSKIIPYYVKWVSDCYTSFRSLWILSPTAHYMSFLRKQESIASTEAEPATKTS